MALLAILATHLIEDDRMPLGIAVLRGGVVTPSPCPQAHLLDWINVGPRFQHFNGLHFTPPCRVDLNLSRLMKACRDA